MHSTHFLINLTGTLQSTECLRSNQSVNHSACWRNSAISAGALQSSECLLINRPVNHSPCWLTLTNSSWTCHLQPTEGLLSNQSVNHSPCWCTLPISSLTCRWSRPERRWDDATGHSLLTQRKGKGDNHSIKRGEKYGSIIALFYLREWYRDGDGMGWDGKLVFLFSCRGFA